MPTETRASPHPPVVTVLRLLVGIGTLVVILLPRPAAAAPELPNGGWPLSGSPAVLREFDPPQERWGAGHRGVDLAARPGQPVLATADGRVTFAGLVAGKPVLVVDHGGVRSTYEPVLASVALGQRVRRGQVVGEVGRASHCPDGCLHWGLKRGADYLDPLSLLGSAGSGGVLRLVPAAQRAVVQREALARAAAEAAASVAGLLSTGPPGSHGFSRPVAGAVTSAYGMRVHPVLHVRKLHDGTDLGAACGTPIRAPYAGRVSQAGYNAGYGHRLFLDHGSVDGHAVETAYNHATHYVVSPGQQVGRGQVIGYVGSTGSSTGCHLHLMVWLDGRAVDPMSWL